MEARLKNIVIQYLVYIGLFIGAGFLSGAIVHYPINPLRFSIIGIIGTLVFVTSSTVNEAIFNNRNFKQEGIVRVIVFSLLLSLGVGMISGGVQHFDEFPKYASYLIPFGILLSLIAFILKNNFMLVRSQIGKLSLLVIPAALLLFIGLSSYAKVIEGSEANDHHASETEQTKNTASSNTKSMNHAEMVKSDADFLMGMIPHHQEAVDSSKQVISKATDPTQKAFIQNIIDVQTKEIETMKGWHKAWYGSDYKADGRYQNMMPELNSISNNDAALVAYFQGMIMHHMGAVQMAQQALVITERPEIEAFSQAVIKAQSSEITTMGKWIRKLQKNNPSIKSTPRPTDELEDDGHMGH